MNVTNIKRSEPIEEQYYRKEAQLEHNVFVKRILSTEERVSCWFVLGVVGDDFCESYLNSLGAFMSNLKGFNKVIQV